MRVVGTAGHVDHGKSTLVRRLTGIDPDRLAEEKAREMTIDLGFAWLPLENGELVGIVDVPGHRDFIENMLAGVGGIDAVILVIAADEGIMPQTREHLAILHLLGVQHGIVALTKTDLVGEDTDWLTMIEAEVHEALAQTALARTEIVRVSAHNPSGINTLKTRLQALLDGLPPRPDYGQPRLPVDRVFTMSGFGTVITGTLTGGTLHVGDEVELLPAGKRGRIRGLQSYKQSVSIAYPGSRVAVNLTGVDRDEVTRGNTLTHPDQLRPTILLDAYFYHLPDAPRFLKHNAPIKFFSGTSESHGYVRLLDSDILAAGEEGWVQFRLDSPLTLQQGDRFIVRYPSPPETIGGGMIVNPHPPQRHKRFQTDLLRALETRLQGSPAQRIAQAAQGREPVNSSALQKLTGYPAAELTQGIQIALDEGYLLQLAENAYLEVSSYHALQRELLTLIERFHAEYPLRAGIPREEVRSKLAIKNTTLTLLLSQKSGIVAHHNLLHHAEHAIRFTPQQQSRVSALLAQFEAAPYTPPSYADALALAGEDIVRALIERGDLVQVRADILLTTPVYDEMCRAVLDIIDTHGDVSAKALRDRFDTSRKYAIGLLEHLDEIGFTRRVGDARVRGKNAPTTTL